MGKSKAQQNRENGLVECGRDDDGKRLWIGTEEQWNGVEKRNKEFFKSLTK